MTRGSTWHIWDFHLHSPYSVLNNQFGDPTKEETWERYISAIEHHAAKKGIVAIGITDYFCIEGYKKVREYQKNGRLQNILIFPNIELRIDKIIYSSRGSGSGKRLNFHVLFSPEVSSDLIEEQFLRNLDFVHQDSPFDVEERRKLTLLNLEDFGRVLQEQHENFRNEPALKVGMMNAVVPPEKIRDILRNDTRFRGKYLLVLAEENLSLMDWDSQDHATRKRLLQMTHAVFSANPHTRNFLLGKKHSSLQNYLDEFKSRKPCIWGCDAHSFESRFLEPDDGRYCWIKSEISWEGMQQILYEPEERVRIQPNNPEPQKSIYTLDSFRIAKTQINDRLSFEKADIALNPNLVAIIGGRGSGKTALLDLIARCFREGQKLDTLKHSFLFRIRSEGIQSVHVTALFSSGDEFTKEVGNEAGKDEVFFEKSNVIYLTQNHLEEYTAEPGKLYTHIIDIVFGKDTEKRREYEEIENEIRERLNYIQEYNLKIEQLRTEVENNFSDEENKLKQRQGELKDYNARLKKYEAQQEKRGKEAEKLTGRLKQLKEQRNKLIGLSERYKSFLEKIKQFREQYIVEVRFLSEQGGDLNIPLVPLPSLDIDTLSNVVSENIGIVESNLPNIEKQIAEVQKEVEKLGGIDRVIADLRQSINNIQEDINDIQSRIDTLNNKKRDIGDLDNKRIATYAEVLSLALKQKIYLQDMIEQFDHASESLLSDLSFQSMIDTSVRKDYIQRVASKADKRSHSEEEIAELLSTIIEKAGVLLNTSEANVSQEEFLQIASELREFGDTVRLKSSVTEHEFFDEIFSRFFRIGLLIKFNERPLESLSMGERAVVLLKILLSLDDRPLLIDQPEEHLDNRYIYNELVPAFRRAKMKRQVIIATHNANLVVNTDAEQIIVAEYNNGTITYRTGALENADIKEDIKTILEGGEQAFRQREEKYGYIFYR